MINKNNTHLFEVNGTPKTIINYPHFRHIHRKKLIILCVINKTICFFIYY